MQEKLPRRIIWFAPWTWKRRTQIVAALLLVIVGYPLSFGPASMLVTSGWMPQGMFAALYYPLRWCADRSEFVFYLLVRYRVFFNSR